MSLHAGTGRREITPVQPLFLVGYPHTPRTLQGVHDPLYATALCLKSAGECLMLVSVDTLFVTRETAARCREAIFAATGVAAERILISATHTHSGPVTFQYLSMSSDPVLPPPDPQYMAQFEAGIVAAATDAWRTAAPALLAAASAPVEGVGCNRLTPDGARDPEAGLLYAVRREDRAPLALVLAYAMHPTVLHEDSLLVSADFPGFTRAHLEARFPGVAVLYHTAPAGDQSPRYHVRGQTFAEARRIGERLGEAVGAALRALPDAAFEAAAALKAARRFVKLPVRRFPAVAESERQLAEAVARFERLRREGAGHGPVRTAECAVFGAEERVTLSRAQEEGRLEPWIERALPAEVQVLRVGATRIVGLPGELFVAYALEIKRRAPARTMVISLANGELQGYVVTPEADAEGGYEASCSLFTAAAGAELARTAIELLSECG